MRTAMLTLLIGLMLLLPAARAGEDAVAGNWKVTILEKANPVELKQMTFWLLRIENKGGKLEGSIDTAGGVPPTTMEGLALTGDTLTFSLKLKDGPTFQFDGKLPRAGAKKIYGTLGRSGAMLLAVLESTGAKTADDMDKELLARSPNDPRVFSTVLDLLAQAKKTKPSAKEVQEWADIAMKAAENYGPRWQLDYSLKLIETLQSFPEYASVAVEAARKAEKSLDAKAPADTQLRVLAALSAAIEAAMPKGEKPPEELKAIDARIDKLESQGYAEYEAKAFDFKIEKFKGRKGKSTRAVMVELFTGAQCPPCVAADLAFDAVEKAYPANDVVLLQYHLHIPAPDALCNDDAEARQNYYGRLIRGTPTVLFNGAALVPGGGGREDGEERFNDFAKAIDPLLEKETAVDLKLEAARKGNAIDIKASVKGLEKPGDKMKLRLALVEDWVRYKAANGTSYHHRVVRAMPGGAKGVALTKADSEHSASVNLEELRGKLTKYLDDYAKTEDPFPDAQRPMRLRNLSVVAFVQNDDTREIVQAANIAVK